MLRIAIKATIWVLIAVGVAFGVGALFCKVKTAPDDSMAPNLMAGDKFLLCYRCDVEKGDAVYCDHPDPNRKGVIVVGRVVGMEGDTVEIRNGLLRVNNAEKHITSDGKQFIYMGPDRVTKSATYRIWNHASLFGHQVPILLPGESQGSLPNHRPEMIRRGHYFLIGDHRPLTLGWTADGKLAAGGGCNSSFCYGQVPASNCRGVIYFRLTSVDRGGDAAPSTRRWSFMP